MAVAPICLQAPQNLRLLQPPARVGRRHAAGAGPRGARTSHGPRPYGRHSDERVERTRRARCMAAAGDTGVHRPRAPRGATKCASGGVWEAATTGAMPF